MSPPVCFGTLCLADKRGGVGGGALFLDKLLVRSCINLPGSSIKVSNKELFTSSDLPHVGILFDLQSGPLHAVIGEVL